MSVLLSWTGLSDGLQGWPQMVPDIDPDKPDPDPFLPDLDPATSGSGSGLPGSRSGNIRIWIRLLQDLDPVAAGSKVPHELSDPVQALGQTIQIQT